MCPDRIRRLQSGFSLVTAIFLVVVLASIAAFIVTVSGLMSSATTLDVRGSRAYQAARAGVEWGASQLLTPAAPPACFATQNLGFAGTGLADFTTTVTCAQTLPVPTDGGGPVSVYQLRATACNQPLAGACPGTAATNYVERQISVTFAR